MNMSAESIEVGYETVAWSVFLFVLSAGLYVVIIHKERNNDLAATKKYADNKTHLYTHLDTDFDTDSECTYDEYCMFTDNETDVGTDNETDDEARFTNKESNKSQFVEGENINNSAEVGPSFIMSATVAVQGLFSSAANFASGMACFLPRGGSF